MHAQAANQARIHALDPTARSRLNVIFMATMILGGACGWDLAGLAYSAWAGAHLPVRRGIRRGRAAGVTEALNFQAIAGRQIG
ncbi:hypothetical protein B5V01_12320 [Mesorhizobium erdmanii]|uniref:MFS transporter n=2 Tax=Mesorhizobium TaxID=68287 RepID=A0A3M9XDB9_9HYPH|nr:MULTISPECIES: hypothetical protein [Mesorhizobium]RNJ46027.1 hypothetical protein DNR46_11470 [Mesorhizobium japonicum]RXT47335.1 hypothetical protein B5V01_12320 [Mesorhizobium erdmanii]